MADPFELSDDEPTPPAPRGPASSNPARSNAEPPYLAGLNPPQRAAVETTEGPVLVLSGAGTGKTRVLTTRLAHLLITGRAWPRQILAVTFTNKAAREMRERVASLIGDVAEGMWLGTFHALAVRILRRHPEPVGLKSNFTILDTDDQLRLLKQVMEAARVDTARWPARVLMGVIQRWKDRGVTPDKVSDAVDVDFANGRAVRLYQDYQDRLRALNAADFGDLLLHNLTLFAAAPEVLADYQRQFKYIMVDEYQDTNVGQYLWLRLLAQQHRNICCVGDDDQSIYGWRGAEVGNILRFDQDFPGARIIRLEQNYRSTGDILAAASGLIAHNAGRLGKTLWTERSESEPVRVRGVWDGDEEARLVGEEIEALQRQGNKLSGIAILVRAGFQTRAFEERFLTLGLPYKVIGGLRFYERREVRDAIAYLRAIVQPDDDLAFERIVNLPKRGIGDAVLQPMHRLSREAGIPLAAAGRRLVETDELNARGRKALAAFLDQLDGWRAVLPGLPHADFVETVLDESGYVAMWQADKSAEAPGRLENLKELVRAIAEFDSLEAFLEHVALVMDADAAPDEDQVSLMTLHSAKGLEFDNVFLPGWEEGLFPHQRALDESGGAGLEEERRLAYVGLTRARRRVTLTHAANRRMVDGRWVSALPSRFIDELPAGHVERTGTSGLWADAATAPSWSYTSARRSAGPVIEGRAWEVRERKRPAANFAVGERVFHQKFGYGRIEDVSDGTLSIMFEKAGPKTVLDSYVERA